MKFRDMINKRAEFPGGYDVRVERYDFMGCHYETTIAPAVERLVSGKQKNRYTIVKHYNTFELTSEDAEKIRQEHPNFYVCYKHFNGSKMMGAFEPFVSVIKDLYTAYEAEKTPQEFIGQFDVYEPQRSVFESMLTQAVFARTEEILLDEVDYEKEQMLKSLTSILITLAKKHPLLLVLNNLNMAAESTVNLLMKFFEAETENVFIYGAFNELYSQLPHMTAAWEKFVEKLEDYNCIVDADEVAVEEESSYFHFSSECIEEYLEKLNNMYTMLDFGQAQYYLAIIYRKIEVEKLSIQEESVFDFFMLYAKISVYSDVPNALLLCDKLQRMQKENAAKRQFEYYYVLGRTQMYNGNLNAAKECADTCMALAEKNLSEYSKFKAALLEVMVRMSGWHNIFFCKTNIEISKDFLEKAKKYGYTNHLAYTYIFAYDNDVKLFKEETEIGENLHFFKKGIELAEKLGNENLLLTAYRKNIMLSSSHGLFQVTNHYYYKSMEIVGDSNPVKLADIYNGLGYSSCATEHYEEANEYYNKAIVIYYRLGMINYVGETLYNMAINCMLAGVNEAAYNYLLTCIRIINILHLNDLRVCNISKIFGLLALCSYRLGLSYNTRIYLDNTLQFLGHTLNRTAQDEIQKRSLDLSYTACDDDIFLYYYVRALVEMEKDSLKKALDFMETAKVYMERSIGNQFFSKVQYEISMAGLLKKMGREQEAEEELEKGLIYAEKCKVSEKKEMLLAAKEGKAYVQKHGAVEKLSGLTLLEIQTATKQAGIVKNYEALQKKMEFISSWQKLMDISGKDFDGLVKNALNTFMLNFNIDVMTYIRYKESEPKVLFDTKEVPLTKEETDVITEYFSTHRSGFVTSKMRQNYMEYNRIISVFGTAQVCSMVCLPYYTNEKLDSIFIMYILMKDNWNAPTMKFMLDESDMEFFNLVLLQLQNSVEKLESEAQIRKINSQLEKSAITDYLTGLYNREGFYQRIHQWMEEKITEDITCLYIDLDNFKFYNDTFGHAAGDRILKEIADILRKETEHCGFPTRFGGDEFLITLPFEDKEHAMALGRTVLQAIKSKNGFADIIREMLEKEIEIPKEKELSCSIGIAAVKGITTEEKIAEAISKADAVLYVIKHSTKGDVKYSE